MLGRNKEPWAITLRTVGKVVRYWWGWGRELQPCQVTVLRNCVSEIIEVTLVLSYDHISLDYHTRNRFNAMSRVDLSDNFTSNFHTFLNKRFASAKLDQISGVKQLRDQNSILTVMYIFSPQPWPQSRQVMLAVMGRGLGNFCAWPSSIACDSVLGEK